MNINGNGNVSISGAGNSINSVNDNSKSNTMVVNGITFIVNEDNSVEIKGDVEKITLNDTCIKNKSFTAEMAMSKLLNFWDKVKEDRKTLVDKNYNSELQDELMRHQDEEFLSNIIGVLDDYEEDWELHK